MALSVGLGLVAGLIGGRFMDAMTAGLVGWNAGVWSYLLLMAWLITHADGDHLERTARDQSQGAAVVLALVICGAVASLVAIGVELSWVRRSAEQSHQASLALPHLLLTAGTVLGAWLLLPMVFTLNYASLYYRSQPGGGLTFPEDEPGFQPHYGDFLYFAVTIAVAAQTSDVVVCRRSIRRLVLLQAILSFGFNTAILALAINIAAGLI